MFILYMQVIELHIQRLAPGGPGQPVVAISNNTVSIFCDLLIIYNGMFIL